MAISAEWIAVSIAGATAVGTLGVRLGVWWQRRKADLPIIRTQWFFGPAGFAVEVTVQNRLQEDVYVTRADAAGPFVSVHVLEGPSPDDPGSEEVLTPSPISPNWLIEAGSKSSRRFRVSGGQTASWIRLTLNSTDSTLRLRKIKLEKDRPT